MGCGWLAGGDCGVNPLPCRAETGCRGFDGKFAGDEAGEKQVGAGLAKSLGCCPKEIYILRESEARIALGMLQQVFDGTASLEFLEITKLVAG